VDSFNLSLAKIVTDLLRAHIQLTVTDPSRIARQLGASSERLLHACEAGDAEACLELLSDLLKDIVLAEAAATNARFARILAQLTRSYHGLWGTAAAGQTEPFCEALAGLFTDVLRDEIRARHGYHFDALARLASLADLPWDTSREAEQDFIDIVNSSHGDSALAEFMTERLILLLRMKCG